MKQWVAKCPSTVHGISLIVRSDDRDLMTAVAQRLRPRLQSSTNIDDLGYWSDLWTLEFKLRPVPEHGEVRKQLAEDVKRIREMSQCKQQLETLIEGYKQLGDKAGKRWAEDELIRLLPKSETARSLTVTRYYDDHPYQNQMFRKRRSRLINKRWSKSPMSG